MLELTPEHLSMSASEVKKIPRKTLLLHEPRSTTAPLRGSLRQGPVEITDGVTSLAMGESGLEYLSPTLPGRPVTLAISGFFP